MRKIYGDRTENKKNYKNEQHGEIAMQIREGSLVP